eukprot:2271378-Amphidinium_carterae.1
MMQRLLAAGRTEHKMGRWFSWEHRSRSLMQHVGLACTLYLIAVTGLRKRWWLTFQSSPLCERRPDPIPAEELGDDGSKPTAAAAAAAASSATDAVSSTRAPTEPSDHPENAAELDGIWKHEVKKKTGNFHLAARVIASSLSRRLNAGLSEMSRSLEAFHSSSITSLKSPTGCRELLVRLHEGALVDVVKQMGLQLMSP